MDARSWDERYRSAQPIWSLEPNRWVVEETAYLPPGRALDLACGEGRNARWLARRGWQVDAVDFSEVALQTARRLAADLSDVEAARLRLQRRDVVAEASGGTGEWRQTYDLVLLSYLHLPAAQRTAVVRSAADALAPGGRLLVVGHDSTNLADGHGGPQDPAVLFTADDIVADLADVPDVAVRRSTRVARTVTVAGGTATALDALVVVVRAQGVGA